MSSCSSASIAYIQSSASNILTIRLLVSLPVTSMNSRYSDYYARTIIISLLHTGASVRQRATSTTITTALADSLHQLPCLVIGTKRAILGQNAMSDSFITRVEWLVHPRSESCLYHIQCVCLQVITFHSARSVTLLHICASASTHHMWYSYFPAQKTQKPVRTECRPSTASIALSILCLLLLKGTTRRMKTCLNGCF